MLRLSTVSLSWIQTSPHLLMTFIPNRVATIQDIIEQFCWFYVPTLDKPADCHRDLLPSKIISHSLWCNGPNWISEETFYVANSRLFLSLSKWSHSNQKHYSFIYSNGTELIKNLIFMMFWSAFHHQHVLTVSQPGVFASFKTVDWM